MARRHASGAGATVNLGAAVGKVARWLKARPPVVQQLLTCLTCSLSRPAPTSPSGSATKLRVASKSGDASQSPKAGRLWAAQWGLDPHLTDSVVEQALEAVFACVTTLITVRFLQLLDVEGIPEEPSVHAQLLVAFAVQDVPERYPQAKELWGFYQWLGLTDALSVNVNADPSQLTAHLTAFVQEVDRILEPKPAWNVTPQDIFRPIREALFPKWIRLAKGEFYTPFVLADYILEKLGYPAQMNSRLLDPSCGSGVFLVAAAWRRAEHFRRQLAEGIAIHREYSSNPAVHGNASAQAVLRDKLLDTILGGGILGLEIQPAAVLAARASLAVIATAFCRRWMPHVPISLSDLTRHGPPVLRKDFLSLWSSLGSGACETSESSFPTISTEVLHGKPFDIIVGNPPWVIWDRLDENARRDMSAVFRELGLFDLSPQMARHGGGKRDCGAAFISAACRVLEQHGRLGMVLPVSLFHSQASGRSFRLLFSKSQGCLRIREVVDLRAVSVFPGTIQRTGILFAEKGIEPRFPVPFIVCRGRKGHRGQLRDGMWPSIQAERTVLLAQPADRTDAGAPWIIMRPSLWEIWEQICGRSEYQAYLGANTGGANGIFWLDVLGWEGNRLVVQNRPEFGRTPVPRVTATVEPDLVFPLVRWKDLAPVAAPVLGVLLVQNPATRSPWPEDYLREFFPATFGYLAQFQDVLDRRAARKKLQSRGPWYAQYNVGPYTMASWKVVWRRMDATLKAVVLGEESLAGLPAKPVIPQETCCFVPVESSEEGHYLAGVLNSPLVEAIIQAFGLSGSRSFGSPSLLHYLRIPRFRPTDPVHMQLAEFYGQAACREDTADSDFLAEWTELAAAVFGTDSERAKREILQHGTSPR
ncbi:MAG: hypothetical protein WHT09_04750 [Thermogutta sp.]